MTSEKAQREIEDLWWLRHCLEAMTETRDTNAVIRVGALRALLKTTEPETSTTDPRGRTTTDTEGAAMSEATSESADPLEPFYRAAREQAREFVTLIKFAEEHGGEHSDPHAIRGQIRQYVRDATDAQVWLLIEVLARSVAATYDDLDDWSQAVLTAIALEDDDA